MAECNCMNPLRELCKLDMKSTCCKLQRQACAMCIACSLSVSGSQQHDVALSAASAELYGNQSYLRLGRLKDRYDIKCMLNKLHTRGDSSANLRFEINNCHPHRQTCSVGNLSQAISKLSQLAAIELSYIASKPL